MKFYLRWFMQNFQLPSPDREVSCNLFAEIAGQAVGVDQHFKNDELQKAAEAEGKSTWDEGTIINLCKERLDAEVELYQPPAPDSAGEEPADTAAEAGQEPAAGA